MTYSRTIHDYCSVCYRYDYVKVDESKFLHKQYCNFKKKRECFKMLDSLPHLNIIAILEKMSQQSFYKIRRVNKALHNFIEENRDAINVNVFHGWSIVFSCKRKIDTQAREDWLYDPSIEFIPPYVPYLGRRESDPELMEIFAEEPIVEISQEEAKISRKAGNVQKFKESSTKYLTNAAKWIKRKMWSRICPSPPRHLTHKPKNDSTRIPFDTWLNDPFLQRELRGHWHPRAVHVVSSPYFGLYYQWFSFSGQYRSDLTKEQWQQATIKFLELIKHSKMSHCYIHFHDLVQIDIIKQFCDALNPTGLYFRKLRDDDQEKFAFPKGFFATYKKVKMLNIADDDGMKFSDMLPLLPTLEFFKNSSYHYNDSPQAPEGSLNFLLEAIKLWKRGGKLKHASLSTKETISNLMNIFFKVEARIPTDEEKERLFEEYPIVRWVSGGWYGYFLRIESDNRSRFGLIFLLQSSIVFHSISVTSRC